jgi:hypothetical protein
MLSCVLLVDYLVAPEFMEAFLERAHRLSNLEGLPGGPNNNSLINFFKTVLYTLGINVDVALLCWIFASTAIIAVTLPINLRLINKGEAFFPHALFLSMLALALILPRFLIYQWTFVIPAVAFVLTRIESRYLKATLAVIALMPTLYINRYLFGLDLPQRVENIFMVPWAFSNVIMVFAFWLVALRLR